MKRATVVSFLLLLIAAIPLRAQTCTVENTPNECINAILAAQAGFKPAEKTEATENAVNKTNTGDPDLSNIGNTALRDFLSLFTAAFRTATIGEENDAITLDYNLPVNLLNPTDVIKFQGTFAKPELDTALKTALGTNETAIKSLSDSLDEGDDVTVSATYSPSSATYGRSFANHRTFVEGMMSAAETELGNKALADLAALADLGVPFDRRFTAIDDAQQRMQIFNRVASIAKGIQTLISTDNDIVAKAAAMINNQPQLYVSAKYRDRNSLAGANGWSLKGTYEFGGKNVTRFLNDNKDCADVSMAAGPMKQTCLSALRTFADEQTPDTSWRFAASLDLQRTDVNEIEIPELTTPVTSKQLDTQVLSVTAGRAFNAPTSSRERRIDVTGSYENVTDDADRDDRAVFTVKWTQEINDSFSLPVTLSWANKERFLGDPDAQFGLHFGLSYKIIKTP